MTTRRFAESATLVGLLIVCGYLVVWGTTWLIGDRSKYVFTIPQTGEGGSSYPGVFMGGLPPVPEPGWGAVLVLALGAGLAGFLLILRRLRRAVVAR